ncbi:hypothetical protein GMOD_00004989 [Pyrenophora seminiperda CCB06]|uniref:Uncharacterized protein n=1 Tax=Pyrenophora seminiperda CCB06 TaxID=1302712 RepID=A0A3M7MI03_9PLEO|nr:hypothetical protein GMOD_00004989 [Pyrenophora seminiperda CCB06]
MAQSQIQAQADRQRKIPNPKLLLGTGKLSSVSQATKLKGFKRPRVQSDGLSSPTETKTGYLGVSQHAKAASSKKQKKSNRVIEMETKHKVDDDAEFVPTQPKQKRLPAKRKTVTENINEHGKQLKRLCVPVANRTEPKTLETSREERSRLVAKSPRSIVSTRHPLIGGLLGSQRPADISTTPFKKPILPARATETLSTPTKPRMKFAETRRSHTPKHVQRRSRHEAYHLSSSPPVLPETDGTGDWLRTDFDLEILSSNSKPVPASPNAESTAISGHADRDDVDCEKQIGDSQTAKNNPFTQRRVNRKTTSFLRRLTGEDQVNEDVDDNIGSQHGVQIMLNGSASSKTDALIRKSREAPPRLPSQMGILGDVDHQFITSQLRQGPDICICTTIRNARPSKVEHKSNELPGYKPYSETQARKVRLRKATSCYRQDSDDERIHHGRSSCRSPTLSITEDERELPQQHIRDLARIHAIDLALPANHEILEDSPFEHTIPPFVVDGIVIKPHSCGDVPFPTAYASSPLTTFPSSPPPPASPSAHGSTSADLEPQTDLLIPSSNAEVTAWESSLHSDQRAVYDSMIRTSKRVSRHIVDDKTTVENVVEEYTRDKVNRILESRDANLQRLLSKIDKEREVVREVLVSIEKTLGLKRIKVRE